MLSTTPLKVAVNDLYPVLQSLCDIMALVSDNCILMTYMYLHQLQSFCKY